MGTLIWLMVVYLICVIVYSVIARYTIYKDNEYVETFAIVKEGLYDFGKIFGIIAILIGIAIGINYLRPLL